MTPREIIKTTWSGKMVSVIDRHADASPTTNFAFAAELAGWKMPVLDASEGWEFYYNETGDCTGMKIVRGECDYCEFSLL